MHQVIYNIIATKDLNNKVFSYISQWGETITSISWEIRLKSDLNLRATPVQDICGRYMIFNLASIFIYKV